jgi:periplasmic mercuric ion binding protein
MKALIFLMTFALIQLTGAAQSNKTETTEFKVYGNCGMCEKRIEKALNIDGVESSEWNKTTKMVKVTFDSKKLNEEKLHQLIAAVGHDTEKVLAKVDAYDKLHKCCKYERNEKVSE